MDIWAIIWFLIITLYIRHVVFKAIDSHNAKVDEVIRTEINKLLLVKIEEITYKDKLIFLMWDRRTDKFLGQSEVKSELFKQVFLSNPNKEEIMIADSSETDSVITVKDIVKRSEVFN